MTISLAVSDSIELETSKIHMANKNLGWWTTVFRALASPYRLEMIRLLHRRGETSVSHMTDLIGISIKNTSRNLLILKNAGILVSQGKKDHVYYSVNPDMEGKLTNLINTFIH